jgi:hypothetical protein
MARNRSVELIVVPSQQPEIPGRRQKWRYAQQYLERRINEPAGGGPYLM